MTEVPQHSATWPTTVGAVCIVVGGLSLFGGCLSLTGVSEIEQLHTAVPFGEGEMSKSVMDSLAATAPSAWISSVASVLVILFSFSLIAFGMSLLLRNPSAPKRLKWWAGLYILFSTASIIVEWVPRMELVQSDSMVQALFLAQLTISLPLYLFLPVCLLIWLNRTAIRNEVKSWV